MTETVRASVSVVLGEEDAPAVESYGAMIITGVESLDIECLPSDLVDRIVVDISGLESIGDSILVRDLPVPDGITILEDPGTMIVVATAPAAEEVEEPEEELELEEGAEPEVIGEEEIEE